MSDMMNALVWQSDANVGLICLALSDVPEEKLTLQPPGLPNHALWQVGHLTRIRAGVAAALGQPGPVAPDVLKNCAPGSTPTADGANYPSRDALLGQFETAHRHLTTVLKSLPQAKLDEPNPVEALRSRFPTVRQFVFGLLTLHDGLHIGQLSAWRRAQDLPHIL
jgi:hypothetical protein